MRHLRTKQLLGREILEFEPDEADLEVYERDVEIVDDLFGQRQTVKATAKILRKELNPFHPLHQTDADRERALEAGMKRGYFKWA